MPIYMKFVSIITYLPFNVTCDLFKCYIYSSLTRYHIHTGNVFKTDLNVIK